MKMERAVFVYTTYPAIVEAERAGRALVERRLCACVNILPGMVSYYWWQGAIERGDEVVMIIKTRASLAERVRAAVKEMHSYSTPAVLVIPSRMSIRTITPGSCGDAGGACGQIGRV
jgi:periplasmic divalent cation tolerance protein